MIEDMHKKPKKGVLDMTRTGRWKNNWEALGLGWIHVKSLNVAVLGRLLSQEPGAVGVQMA